jgi:hypothetical protein
MAAGFYIAIMPGILAIMAGAAWFTDHYTIF